VFLQSLPCTVDSTFLLQNEKMVLIENNMQLSSYMHRCKVCVDISVTDFVLRFLLLCCIRFPLYICLINLFALFYMLSVHSVGKSCNSCGVGFDLGVHFACGLVQSLYCIIKEI